MNRMNNYKNYIKQYKDFTIRKNKVDKDIEAYSDNKLDELYSVITSDEYKTFQKINDIFYDAKYKQYFIFGGMFTFGSIFSLILEKIYKFGADYNFLYPFLVIGIIWLLLGFYGYIRKKQLIKLLKEGGINEFN